MRVVFICPTLAVGGAERLLSALVLRLRDHEIEPTVIALNHTGRFFDELRQHGVDARFAGMRSRYDVRGARRAGRMIRAARPTVIVTQSVDAHVIGWWEARRSRIPHVAIEHGGPGLSHAFHRRVLMRLMGPRFDLAIAVTESQVPGLVAFGYPASRIRVIPNGISEPEPRRDRADVRAELGVGDGELLALLVAVLRPEKQASRFVDAVVEARRRGCPVRGAVAGSGPELPEVRRRAAGVDGIVALGERADVPDLISAADIVCLTSRAEGLPMVVLEAMALGRPILSPAIGGIPEAIGDNGILVTDDSVDALASALCAATQERDRLATLGHAARARYLERFSLDQAAESYSRVLREVTEGASTR